MKYRGKPCMNCGGNLKKMQLGGCHDSLGNNIPCQGEMTNASDNGQWNRVATNPMQIPQQQTDVPRVERITPGTVNESQAQPNGSKSVDPLFSFLGATNGLSWLSGVVDRKRQDNYMNSQFAQFNQMNPMPADDYQPNPFSLYSKYGGKIRYQSGGSIVDYLASKGANSSFDARKGYFNSYFGNESYKGTAEQNLRLLKTVSRDKSFVPSAGAAPIPRGKVPASPAISAGANGISDMVVNSGMQAINMGRGDTKLQSGVVVDKRTGKAFIVQGGKKTKEFPVLTGQNMESNSNPWTMDQMEEDPSRRATPVGSYTMNPQPDVYGMPGYFINGINAFGQTKPDANGLAMHLTYDPNNRNKYYGTNQSNQSYGCINCRKPDLQNVLSTFPKGDTLTVVDSNTPRGKAVLSQYKEGGKVSRYRGSMRDGDKWIQKAVNPDHKGWCTPLSNPHCTGRRRAFALMMKKKHGFH